MASKIFPFGVGNPLDNSFKLILVAEGFTAAQKADFATLCQDLLDALLATTPFNVTRAHPGWLTVLKVFAPSANVGPRIGAGGGHSTVLGSFVDSSTNRLVVDHALLYALLNVQVVTDSAGPRKLSELVSPGDIMIGPTGAVIAVITPATANPAQGADDHVRPIDDTTYHLVATTANGLWHQVVLRGIAAALGLADEFERPDAAYASASDSNKEFLNTPNVIFRDTPPTLNSDVPAWRHVMSGMEWLAPAVVHAHPPNDLPNTAMPAAPSVAGKIEFWEGGAGYRRKSYRSAEDCLMRRAPGLGYLPARNQAVAFCPVCLVHLRSMLR